MADTKLKNDLIGARLIHISNEGFIVRLSTDGSTRHFVFEEEPGDCCGFSEVTTKLLIDKEDLRNAPAITDVQFQENEGAEGDSLIITLFGISKPLAIIDSFSSSGSGWCYGSAMWVKCKETKKYFQLTSW